MTDTPTTAPADAPPALEFVRAVVGKVELEHPLRYGGRVFSVICLRRLTYREVESFIEETARKIQESGGQGDVRLPIFADEAGQPIPDAVFDALDDVDATRLQEAANGFLPRRFRAAAVTPEPASAPITAGSTEPS